MATQVTKSHPRETKDGMIECANCLAPLAASARSCPKCDYPWPRSRDQNEQTCRVCDKSIPVYGKRRYDRLNHWDKFLECPNCGALLPGFGKGRVEARGNYAPPASGRESFVTFLFILAIIALIVWAL